MQPQQCSFHYDTYNNYISSTGARFFVKNAVQHIRGAKSTLLAL